MKSRQNRQSVQRALKKCIERLKLEKETPENGAVLLCGTDFGNMNIPNSSPYFFEPPLPVKRFTYLCDNRFHVGEIIPLFEYNEGESQKYGVCIVNGSDAKLFFYLPEIDDFRTADCVSRSVRNRHGRGGYSQNRYQRLRDNEIKALVGKICDLCEEYCFSDEHVFNVGGIVIAGNAGKKNLVAKHLIEILDIPSSHVNVITTDGTIERSQYEARKEICHKLCPKEQRQAEKDISEIIERNPDILVFGKREVSEGLQEHTLRKVYVLKGSCSEKMQRILDENQSVEKITFKVSPVLENFGDFIGIKWY